MSLNVWTDAVQSFVVRAWYVLPVRRSGVLLRYLTHSTDSQVVKQQMTVANLSSRHLREHAEETRKLKSIKKQVLQDHLGELLVEKAKHDAEAAVKDREAAEMESQVRPHH